MNPESNNLLLFTQDSYKVGHHPMYMPGTEYIYSYYESRNGAQYPYTIWFGLQYIVKRWLTNPVTQAMVDEVAEFCKLHFIDDKNVFNKKGWEFIVNELGGHLPLRIKSVPEGMKVATSNVMMTCENTHPECPWLTNVVETVLSTVWYTSVVATKSHFVMQIIKKYFNETSDTGDLYKFFLHDFGQRGTTCMEHAGLGGMAHLLNSRGTDTLMAFPYAKTYYNADVATLGYSVKASEHSIMTAMGEENEFDVTRHIINSCPDGILSVVSDSYNIENAIKVYCTDLKQDILNRNGKFVVRPDSPRFKGDTCANQVYWIADQLWTAFGGTVNSKGYRVLNSKVGIIYGDGIDTKDIEETLELLKKYKFSAENCVFGMGGGLLQRGLNRDTQRNAFKASSMVRNGERYDIFKNPSDKTKASKKGRLKYVCKNGVYQTVSEYDEGDDIMRTVYEDGQVYNELTFDQIRENVDMW